ncbi:acyl dehydratase [Mycobacterium sp. DL440]|uniref:acyl dehydratase n=1 Tax=Mycobacterium sp. DL440 TaxID=2675523 RepID=UPI0014224BF8|nr:acyl dehydratase [Mycobacterium sp. DL440]
MTTTYETTQLFADDVAVGYELDSLVQRPTTVQLFRYCAVTWNSHRIHFDRDYAATEGYPDVLVQSHLHGAFLTSLCDRFAGAAGRIERLSYSVRRFAIPGDTLIITGAVSGARQTADGAVFSVDIREERRADDTVCAQGEAEIFLPARAGSIDSATGRAS